MYNSISIIDQRIEELTAAYTRGSCVSVSERIRLCRESLDALKGVSDEWSATAAAQKLCPKIASIEAEEMLAGPVVVARQLQLTIQTLQAIANEQAVCPTRSLTRLSGDQIAVSVFPTTGYYDSLTFMRLHGQVIMQPGINEASIHGSRLELVREGRLAGICAVLGAGNVSSIPATDSLNQIMFEGRQVVLKMNPVNEYLAPLFETVFASLIEKGLLRIITGSAEVGQYLVNHPDISDVHITGSARTHDQIVWGADPTDRERRRKEGNPLLKKTVTSELGNVSPWIIVPGKYTDRQLDSQAQHIAASITNNASFNCLATKVIVTWSQWKQREHFLNDIRKHLRQTKPRPAYYPGAADRFRRFAATDTPPDDNNCLPWTLLTAQSIDQRPELFTEESFVCVCAETALEADSPAAFVNRATDFVNHRMTGSLCASITIPVRLQPQEAVACNDAIHRLQYGSVCVNQWSGLAYALTSPPWGAYPGATISNVDSGIGAVHNTYLLDGHQKTILQGPLVSFPKPVWFPAHRNSLNVARQLMALYYQPSIIRLPKVFAAALKG